MPKTERTKPRRQSSTPALSRAISRVENAAARLETASQRIMLILHQERTRADAWEKEAKKLALAEIVQEARTKPNGVIARVDALTRLDEEYGPTL